jgi:hypothetical protein
MKRVGSVRTLVWDRVSNRAWDLVVDRVRYSVFKRVWARVSGRVSNRVGRLT